MSGLRKILKKAASAIGSVVIVAGASHGLLRTAAGVAAGRGFEQIPHDLVLNYTGFDTDTNHLNTPALVASVLTIVGAIAAGKLIKYAGRSV